MLRQVRQRSRLPIIMLTAKGTTWIEWWDWRWGPMTVPKPLLPQGAGGPAAGRPAAGQRGEAQPPRRMPSSWGADGHPGQPGLSLAGEPLELTATEFNMLVLLVRTPSRWSPRTPSPARGGASAGRPMTAASMCTSATCGRNCSRRRGRPSP